MESEDIEEVEQRREQDSVPVDDEHGGNSEDEQDEKQGYESDDEDASGGFGTVVDGWTLLMGEDVKIKVISTSNSSEERPPVQADVCCSFTVALMNEDKEPSNKIVHSRDNITLRIGAGDTIPAMELGLRYNKPGDVFLLHTSSKFAYGPKGLAVNDTQCIPPDSALEIQVTVHSYTDPKAPPEMNLQDIEAELAFRKATGNRLLTEGEPQRALRCYGQCLKQFQGSDLDVTQPEAANVRQLIIDMLNNTAAVQLQQHEYRKAKEACISVLEMDPNNVKALYRAGKAAILTADYDEAEAALKRAMEIEPNDRMVLKEYKELKRREKAYSENSKQMFKSMGKQLFAPKASQLADESTQDAEVVELSPTTDAPQEEPQEETAKQEQDLPSVQEIKPAPVQPAATVAAEKITPPIKESKLATKKQAKPQSYTWVIPIILGVGIALALLFMQQQG